AFSDKGEGVITFRPVYYPFQSAIMDNERTEVNVPLINQDNYYTIDFEKFEEAARDSNNKVLLFCSPHNPVGRVWTEEELEKVADIAIRHDLYVISDEIWYDFVMPGYEHTVLAKVNENLHDKLITCTAPSKSFNLAGMTTSNIIISNRQTRDQFEQELKLTHGNTIGILGFKANELAYTKDEGWLDELLEVIDTNQHLVHTYFKEHFQMVKAPLIEGTYLQWLDFNELGMSNKELEEFLYKEAEFFTNQGYVFGKEGSGYERVNLALPTDALKEALDRLVSALQKKFNP